MSEDTDLINKVNAGIRAIHARHVMLLNAHALLHKKYKGKPLWAFVADITGHGSTYSVAICKEYGWNADQDGSIRLK